MRAELPTPSVDLPVTNGLIRWWPNVFDVHDQITGQEGVVMGTHKVWVQLQTTGSKEDKDHQKRLARQQSDPEIKQILQKYAPVGDNNDPSGYAADVESSMLAWRTA